MKLAVQLRENLGSNGCRSLRRRGLIPGIIYGRGREPEPVQLPLADFLPVFKSGERMLDVELGDKHERVIIKEVQLDPFGDVLVHVDFKRVAKDERIKIRVKLETIGTPKGVIAGGVLDHLALDVEVECLVTSIPDHLEANISELEIGHILRIQDLAYPEGVKPVGNPMTPLLAIHAPRKATVDEAVAPEAIPVEGAEAASAPQEGA